MSAAHIEGAAVLNNPRSLGGKNLLFDASFYLFPGQTILAALRYYNDEDMVFNDQGSYFVHASVVLPPAEAVSDAENAQALEQIRESGDYDLVGDIDWILPVHMQVFEMKHQPYVEICGTAKNVSATEFTFDLDASQYVWLLKGHGNGTGLFRIHATIPSTGKYSHKRPLPQENSFVFVSGFVFDTVEDDHQNTSQFVIGVRDMVFGGRQTMAKEQTVSAPNLKKRKGRFNFEEGSFPPKRPRRDTTGTDAKGEEVEVKLEESVTVAAVGSDVRATGTPAATKKGTKASRSA